MRVVYFTQSLVSCWNHGNAHFLRGVLRELTRRGHEVMAWEPADGWSRENLLRDHGRTPLQDFAVRFPELKSNVYAADFDAEQAIDGADLVIVHEWTDPQLVARLGRIRSRGADFRLLFHDTHHRAVSDPDALRQFNLDGYDGVLAFGESLAEIYRRWGWGDRIFTWHEAADTSVFKPLRPSGAGRRNALVWIGNWGDGERSDELNRFLFEPARREALPLTVHGVRYPPEALAALKAQGADYRGWLPNADAPQVFADHLATVHVPRRFYVEHLPGVPTIRVFEALACGIPLISSYWPDTEHLFRPGDDFLVAGTSDEMQAHLCDLANDAALRKALAESGLETIRKRHSCKHRADELMVIAERIGAAATSPRRVA